MYACMGLASRILFGLSVGAAQSNSSYLVSWSCGFLTRQMRLVVELAADPRRCWSLRHYRESPLHVNMFLKLYYPDSIRPWASYLAVSLACRQNVPSPHMSVRLLKTPLIIVVGLVFVVPNDHTYHATRVSNFHAMNIQDITYKYTQLLHALLISSLAFD